MTSQHVLLRYSTKLEIVFQHPNRKRLGLNIEIKPSLTSALHCVYEFCL